MFTSDLLRAMCTAEPIARRLRVPIEPRAGLREQCVGIDQDRRSRDVWAETDPGAGPRRLAARGRREHRGRRVTAAARPGRALSENGAGGRRHTRRHHADGRRAPPWRGGDGDPLAVARERRGADRAAARPAAVGAVRSGRIVTRLAARPGHPKPGCSSGCSSLWLQTRQACSGPVIEAPPALATPRTGQDFTPPSA